MLLSCLKILKRYIVLLSFVTTVVISGFIVNLVQCILYCLLRPVNKQLYRKINWYLCYTIYAQLVWLVEWWSGINLIIYMNKNDFEKYVGKDHCICIMNHSYEIDWLLALILSDRMHLLGSTKAYIKKSLQYIPIIGWTWKFSDYVMLERSFEKDKEIIEKQVAELTTYPDAVVLLLFPEGTRFTPEKHKASEEFARLNNKPSLKYHLQPRTRGFITSLPVIKKKVPCLYDIIVAFKEDGPIKPTMANLLMGESVTAYVYIKRISIENLPPSENELKKYFENMYVKKDKLKESFVKTGDFFAISGEPKVTQIILNRRYYSLINMVLWAVVILCPIGYYLMGLLFSGDPFYYAFGIGLIGTFTSIPYVMVLLTETSNYGIKNVS